MFNEISYHNCLSVYICTTHNPPTSALVFWLRRSSAKDALEGLVNALKEGLLGKGALLAVQAEAFHGGHLDGGIQPTALANVMGNARQNDDDHEKGADQRQYHKDQRSSRPN